MSDDFSDDQSSRHIVTSSATYRQLPTQRNTDSSLPDVLRRQGLPGAASLSWTRCSMLYIGSIFPTLSFMNALLDVVHRQRQILQRIDDTSSLSNSQSTSLHPDNRKLLVHEERAPQEHNDAQLNQYHHAHSTHPADPLLPLFAPNENIVRPAEVARLGSEDYGVPGRVSSLKFVD